MIAVRMAETTEVVHVPAVKFHHDRGALVALDAEYGVVAIFAPGHWASAIEVPTLPARDARGRFVKGGES